MKTCATCFNQFRTTGPSTPCATCASEYQNWQPRFKDMVAGLAKPGQAILATMTPETIDLLHMAVGVAGEAGELLDAVKKNAIYNKPLDRANVIEELGDIEFYMEHMRSLLGITREETLSANIEKLGKRYVGMKYTDTAAQQRADKQNEGEKK